MIGVYIALTGKEWVRKRVLYAAVALTALFVGLFAYGVKELSGLQQAEPLERLLNHVIMLYLGLFFAQFITAFVVLFACMGTLSGERESGLLLAILARPQPRWKIYAAKWIGHAAWLLLFSTLLFGAIVAIIRFNGGFPYEIPMLLKSWALFEAVPLLLLTVTMLGSVYLPTLGNGIFAALLYGFALFSGFLEGINAGGAHPAIDKLALLTGLVMPTDAVFRRCMYELIGGGDLPLPSSGELGPFSLAAIPSNAFLLYAACYAALLLLLGFRAFSRKDI